MSKPGVGSKASVETFECRLERLDLTLFDSIPTQSSQGDRTSWLTVQRAMRRNPAGYVYLEIGSHLGGSLQQHVLDPLCRKIFSIDKRPVRQPDAERRWCDYEGNSTQRMLENIRGIDPNRAKEIVCFDADASEIPVTEIKVKPNYCFIDGEHTKAAALSDFLFCLSVCDTNAAICFHDDWLIYTALKESLRILREKNIKFVARKLGGATFGIFLGNCEAALDSSILKSSYDGEYWLARRTLVASVKRFVPERIWEKARSCFRV